MGCDICHQTLSHAVKDLDAGAAKELAIIFWINRDPFHDWPLLGLGEYFH